MAGGIRFLVCVVCLATVSTLGAWPVEMLIRQPGFVQPGNPGSGQRSSSVITDRQQSQRLQQVQKFIEEKNYDAAFVPLRMIIEAKNDAFVLPDPADKTTANLPGRVTLTTIKQQIDKAMSRMPAEGRRAYQLRFGNVASGQVEEAIRANRIDQLNEVVRLYFHTSAGANAAFALGSYYMDRSEFSTAARLFERIRNVSWYRDRLEPLLSIKTATCWHRAGMRDEARRVLVDLKSHVNSKPVSLGGKQIELFTQDSQAVAWLESIAGKAADSTLTANHDWLVHLGNPSRSALSSTSTPAQTAGWIFPLLPADGESDSAARNLVTQSDGNEEELSNEFDPGSIDIATLADGLWRKRQRNRVSSIPAMQALMSRGIVVFRTLKKLTAVDASTGEVRWQSFLNDVGYEQITGDQNRVSNSPANAQKANMESLLQNRLWRDATWGVISSDGRYVYTVDEYVDLSTARTAMARMPGFFSNPFTSQVNRLVAYELESGRLMWEVGGSHSDYELKDAGTFFLGAPLPMSGRLFCTIQEGGEIRLAEIDPQNGNIVWSQSLAPVPQAAMLDLSRWKSGASPASDGSVIVCPTTTGSVVAVDLAQRQLLWQYRYRPMTTSLSQGRQMIMFQMMRQRNMATSGSDPMDEDRWIDNVPRIHGGQVLMTPVDGNELLSLNLLTGELNWQVPRDDSLYVAATWKQAAIVVGRSKVFAVSLRDGQKLWKQSTPIPHPSGRGTQSGRFYHLPLTSGEVATIDLANGMILTKTRIHPDRVPGNLTASQGTMVSLSHDGLIAFRNEQDVSDQLKQQLVKDANDADALATRGRMRLHAGYIEDGLADLKESLKIDDDLSLREQLVDTMLEQLRVDFAKHRGSADKLEALVVNETQRQRFHRQFADGLLIADEPVAAFREYLNLAGPTSKGADSMFEQPSIKVSGDAWMSGRFQGLLNSGQETAAIDKIVKEQFDTSLAADNVKVLRRFVRSFDGHQLSDVARRKLVDRLTGEANSLERERVLRQLQHADDTTLNAFATSQLAELYLDRGRFALARNEIKQLESQFASVDLGNSKNGKQLAEQLRSDAGFDKEPTPYPWPKFTTVKQSSPQRSMVRTFPVNVFDRSGTENRWMIQLDYRRTNIIALDQRGVEQWKLDISGEGLTQPNPYTNSMHILPSIAVLTLGNRFMVIDIRDPKSPKVLWRRNLYQPLAQANMMSVRVQPRANGIFQAMTPNGGMAGTVYVQREECIVYSVGKKLHCADSLTGEILWTRENFDPESIVTGDADFVIQRVRGQQSLSVISTRDGSPVRHVEIAGRQVLLRNFGRMGLYSEFLEDQRVLSFVDMSNGQKKWQRKFSLTAEVDMMSNDNVAVLERGGHLLILNTQSGTPILESETGIKEKVLSFSVIPNREQYILLTRLPNEDETVLRVDGLTRSQILVHGPVMAFDRKTGRQLWKTEIQHRSLGAEMPLELPLMVFAARLQRTTKTPNGQRFHSEAHVQLLDPRTGKIVHTEEQPRIYGAYEIEPAVAQNRINVRFNGLMLSVDYTNKPPEEPKPEAPKKEE